MPASTPAVAARRWPRRLTGAVRSLRPGTVIAVSLALLAGGTGIAGAATGGTFILGTPNGETSTASLSNSKGTPLSLSAHSGKAPLAVNRNTMVKHLHPRHP